MTTKVALITGASRPIGIGFAVGRQLAEQGHHVVLTSRDATRAEQLAEQLRTDGHAASALRIDLIEPATFHDAAAYLSQTFGHLDVLINNATHGPDFTVMSALDADLDVVRTTLDVDLIGTWGLILAMLPLLKKAPAARIVNVSSKSAQQIATGLDLGAPLRAPAYSMAKHMLNVLTTTMARALADTPILVNAVDPGDTATHPERGDDDDSRTSADSARGIVWAATLDHNGPTGGLFYDKQPMAQPLTNPLVNANSSLANQISARAWS
jgi:NAD(P)-dependent dehydrogenase (short-subunit alcohol dehydrogenase family)